MSKKKEEIIVWEDLDYGVLLEWEEDEEGIFYHIDFKVFEIQYIEEYPEKGRVSFSKSVGNSYEGITEMKEADVFCSGGIKWDGCSNIQFDKQERVMLHFCSKKSAENVGILLGRLYDKAEEMIPGASF